MRFLLIALFSLIFLNSCKEINDEKKKEQNNDTFITENNEVPNEFKNLVNDFENKSRVIWQKPEMVINLLGNIDSQTVADIGAGTGYFSFRILPKAKKVIAIDIDPRFITFMDSVKKELPADYQSKFESRLVKPDNPNFKQGEVNSVIVVNTYMYIENRKAYLKILKKGMAAGAKIVIIDYKNKNLPVGPPTNLTIPLNIVENELKETGFKNIISDDTSLDYQYIITAINM
jgi:predicted RNA methylase